MSEARHNTAIISEATEMSNPDSLGVPFALPPQPANDIPQLPLVHVHDPSPDNPVDVDIQFIALVNVVVKPWQQAGYEPCLQRECRL